MANTDHNMLDASFIVNYRAEMNQGEIWSQEISSPSSGYNRHPASPVATDSSTNIPAEHAELAPTNNAPHPADIYWRAMYIHRTTEAMRNVRRHLRKLLPLAVIAWTMICAAFRVPRVSDAALSHACTMQIISTTFLCASALDTIKPSGEAQWADFPSLVSIQDSITDTFVGEGPGGSEMALQIVRAEMATSDLIIAVRFSKLKASKKLAESLVEFVTDASEVAESLQDLDAKAHGAIDSLLNINDWALQAIDRPAPTPGLLQSITFWRVNTPTTDLVSVNFNAAMNSQSKILTGLVVQATLSQAQLKKLKTTLQAIRDLAIRENIDIDAEQGELLASIWTQLGANRKDLRVYDINLELLKNLEKYTDNAKDHISQALMNLGTMQAQMKDLRERVSQPDIAGTDIPLDVHIRTIAEGMQRMKAGKIRARARERDLRTLGAE